MATSEEDKDSNRVDTETRSGAENKTDGRSSTQMTWKQALMNKV